MFWLSESSLTRAIRHLCKFGDTDVFPHLPELAFFGDESAAVAKELTKLDLDTYNPSGAFEALAPKSRYGFRITHQLGAVDNVLLLAAVVEIGHLIEARRPPSNGIQAFSYRFDPKGDESLFLVDHSYKHWLQAQQARVQGDLKVKQVVYTDISDFYARINFHRLENLLDEAAPGHGAAKYIKKHIKIIRAKQSFGLPVGGTAARILAELALSDTDKALMDQGVSASRFVDDFRIFLTAGENPYDVLSFLAQQLSINEGLALNAAKTSVVTRSDALKTLKELTSDISDDAQGKAIEALTANIYFDETPDPNEVEALKALNLLGILQEEIGKDRYDLGRIKVVFRALKIAKPLDAIKYISDNLPELVVFAKEVILLMQAIESDNKGCFSNLAPIVINSILSPPASSVQIIRTWLLELFVRDVVPITPLQFKILENIHSILDRRQLHLIRGRLNNKNYFRMHKANLAQIPPIEQIAFIMGASCLPGDEFKNWAAAQKVIFSGPTSQIFLGWVQANKDEIISQLGAPIDDHPE